MGATGRELDQFHDPLVEANLPYAERDAVRASDHSEGERAVDQERLGQLTCSECGPIELCGPVDVGDPNIA